MKENLSQKDVDKINSNTQNNTSKIDSNQLKFSFNEKILEKDKNALESIYSDFKMVPNNITDSDKPLTLSSSDPNKKRSVGNPSKNLSESDIRWAMKNSDNNTKAADFLNVHIATYRKYAKSYIDRESGKSLYDMHRKDHAYITRNYTKQQWREWYGKKFVDRRRLSNKKDLIKVLSGEDTFYDYVAFKERLFEEGIKKRCCETCGYSKERVTDQEMPLVIKFRNGDKSDQKLENIEIVCRNCEFLYYGRTNQEQKELKEFYGNIHNNVDPEEAKAHKMLEQADMLTSSDPESSKRAQAILEEDAIDWEE